MRSNVVRQTGLVAIVLALLLLTIPFSSATLRAMPMGPEDTSEVETYFEGYLKAIGPGKWLIGTMSVLVDSSTVIIEKFGRAEVGAWLAVWATLYDSGSMHANIISVESPAGRSGPTYQFSGIITKQEPGAWIVVDDFMVEITPQTQIIGEPSIGWLVWVVAEDDGDGLRGIVIEAIADTPADLPVEFEGQIESIAADQWRVDGQDVAVDTSTVFLGATPTVGFIGEVRATRNTAGQLLAHMIRVLDPAAPAAASAADGAQTWAALIPEAASASPAAGSIAATPWGNPIAIARGLADAARPSLVYSADGIAHALWEVRGQIYYAYQLPRQAWSPAARIATGSAPTILANSAGQVHALFYNEFFGNYETYHVVLNDGHWSLPINVSRTEGVSMNPTLAIDAAGILHAAWMDSTPGYWIIYNGYYDGKFWRNYPVSNARGQAPAIATAPNGTIYLAWQDRVPTASDTTGTSEIFISQYKNGVWSLPINVSDHPGVEATSASVAATYDSMAHLTWLEDEHAIMYCNGRDLYWPAPQTVTQTTKVARGPRIIAEKGKILHIAWDEGDAVRTTMALPVPPAWPKPEIVTALAGDLKDVSLTEALGNGITIGWADLTLPDDAGIYVSVQSSSIPSRVWLPVTASR